MDTPAPAPEAMGTAPEATGGNDYGGVAPQVEQTYSESHSVIAWESVAFTVFWIVGMLLLIAVIAIAWRDKRQRQATSVTETSRGHQDVEQAEGRSDRRQYSGNCLPYGAATAIPIFTALTAFVMSIIPHTSCEFLSVSENDEFLTMGMWSVAYVSNGDFGGEGNCYSNFPLDFEVNAAMRVARASAIIATTVGGISMLVLLYCSSMVANLRISQIRRLALPLLAAAFFQGLTLLLFDTEECAGYESCSLYPGGGTAVTAAFYWFLSAVGISLVPLNNDEETK